MKKIIHIDMDAFYASVEERDNPSLRGKPVVVGGPPNSRAVVSTANYIARQYGVHSAMPCSVAQRLCPQAIFVPHRFSVYKEISGEIREIFYEYTDLVEPLSLDEAYLDVTLNKYSIPSAIRIAREIKEKIKNKTQLTASAGVAGGKFLAKVASGMNKPDGLTVILPEEAREFLLKLPIGKFFGIGKKTEEKMKSLGIHSGKELFEKSEAELTRFFGKMGGHYFRIVRGIDHSEVRSSRMKKSISTETTFEKDIEDLSILKQKLKSLCDDLERRLQKSNLKGKSFVLKVKYEDFSQVTKSFLFNYYVQNSSDFFDRATQILNSLNTQKKVRLLGVGLSHLNNENQDENQMDLFSSGLNA